MIHILAIGDYLKRGKKGREEIGRYFAESVQLLYFKTRRAEDIWQNVNVFFILVLNAQMAMIEFPVIFYIFEIIHYLKLKEYNK